jgi:dienelactone hydrolase
MRYLLTLLAACGYASVAFADPLPNTQPLTFTGDPAAAMVAGIHKYLDRETAAAVEKSWQFWKLNFTSPEAFAKSVQPNRERLKKILGVVDKRLPPEMELITATDRPALIAESKHWKTYAVRWPVLPGVDGEGLLIEPTRRIAADVVVIPDADWIPEMISGLRDEVPKELHFASRLAEEGCRVIVPTLIDRADDFSGSARLNKWTNQPHREFIYRMAFEMGRHIIGYEVQKVLAAVDWFQMSAGGNQIGVYGVGEGALVACMAATVDPRILAVGGCGYFPAFASLSEEPIYRNLWGVSAEVGVDGLKWLGFTRAMGFDAGGDPVVTGPPAPRAGRSGAAPGRIEARRPRPPRSFEPSFDRSSPPSWAVDVRVQGPWSELFRPPSSDGGSKMAAARVRRSPGPREKRQFDQLVACTQKLWRDSEFTRDAFFWKKTDSSSPEKWQKSCDPLRAYLWAEVIGKLPPPTLPPNPRTRQVYDEPKWSGHEVMLDLYPDVFAYGILLTPKDLKPGQRRPVVVCQHGLEGTPRSCIDAERRPIYNRFAARLADLGYIVYCPQNPYYGENTFRQVQRKANPLKLSLFSFIIQQHATTIDWLCTLPYVDKDRIAFYGLSYGGKTAMRVPAVEPRYCLSICSGDFNEWIGKNVSVDLDRSYMWTREYEMPEFDLGNTFNYAEMAGLIAPRPFMVERGHRDGVGTDEMVAYEYAKVRRLYANLKIPERTAIEFFEGGHEIRAVGTFAFLKQHLGWPK